MKKLWFLKIKRHFQNIMKMILKYYFVRNQFNIHLELYFSLEDSFEIKFVYHVVHIQLY